MGAVWLRKLLGREGAELFVWSFGGLCSEVLGWDLVGVIGVCVVALSGWVQGACPRAGLNMP